MSEVLEEVPFFRGKFHQAMFFIGFGSCALLLLKCETTLQYLSISAYTISILTMFGVSALYHRIDWSDKADILMQKFDHCAIYITITGTAIPIGLLGMNPEDGKKLVLTLFIVSLLGVIYSLFFSHLPNYVRASLYVVGGSVAMVFLPEFYESLGINGVFLLLGGGIVYIVGALSYGLKRPVLSPKYFSYHEVFHLLVNLGAFMHFVLIYTLLK